MDREHVISVVLSNEDWKAFLKVQPQPVTWLLERIQEQIRVQEQIAASRQDVAPAGIQTAPSV